MCGATRPMNPIMPAKAVAAPTNSAAARMISRRTRLVETPRCAACASPSCRASSERALRNIRNAPAAKKASNTLFRAQSAPPQLPSVQKVIDRSALSLAEKRAKPSTLPSMAFSAMPARISRAAPPDSKPVLKSRRSPTASNPPRNAIAGSIHPPKRSCHTST